MKTFTEFVSDLMESALWLSFVAFLGMACYHVGLFLGFVLSWKG